jgi:hypothetical protein
VPRGQPDGWVDFLDELLRYAGEPAR